MTSPMGKRKLLLLAAIGALLTAAVHAVPSSSRSRVKLPSFVKVCRRNDPELNECARDALNALKERLSVGIPELFIPSMEPLIIPEMKLDQDSGAIYLHSTCKDIHIHGLSDFTLNDLIVDPKKTKLTMAMTFPSIAMRAQYVMRGKIMLMPLVGEGDFNANFTNVELKTVILGERYKKHGRTFVRVKDVKVRYDLGQAKVRLENLFNGDTALGDRMNTFLNENWESLSDEVRPLMERAMADVIRSSTDQLFKTYSFDDLLPE